MEESFNESFKDNTREAHHITNYDLVYVLLKPSSSLGTRYPDVVKVDSHRKKPYITGKVIELGPLPRYHSLALVPQKDYTNYAKAKKFADKEKFVINISFGEIEFITLDFESLDWKK